jgi:hypothetical protein
MVDGSFSAMGDSPAVDSRFLCHHAESRTKEQLHLPLYNAVKHEKYYVW